MGASEILITDLVQQRLDVAKELGATHTLLLTRDQTAEETAELVCKKMTAAPDHSIDCCGAESSARLAIFVSQPVEHLKLGNELRFRLAGHSFWWSRGDCGHGSP